MHARWTENARTLMETAHKEARQAGNNQTDTTHVLLAIVNSHLCTAHDILKKTPANLALIKRNLQEIIGRNFAAVQLAKIPQSNDVKLAIECAMQESHDQGAPYIGTEHILLGLLRGNGCVAVELLSAYDVTASVVRRIIRKDHNAQEPATQAHGQLAEERPAKSLDAIDAAHRQLCEIFGTADTVSALQEAVKVSNSWAYLMNIGTRMQPLSSDERKEHA